MTNDGKTVLVVVDDGLRSISRVKWVSKLSGQLHMCIGHVMNELDGVGIRHV